MTNSKNILQQLHDELERIQPKDAETAASLEAIKAQLRAALDESDETVVDRETLIDRLNEAAYQLEVDHPGVASLMNTVINTLSNLGI